MLFLLEVHLREMKGEQKLTILLHPASSNGFADSALKRGLVASFQRCQETNAKIVIALRCRSIHRLRIDEKAQLSGGTGFQR
jgi:hypothetical protein